MKSKNLSPELEKMRQEVEKVCKEHGLDFYPTIFQVLDFNKLNEMTSYHGFPNRYPHWRFGMEYEHLQKQLGYGFGRLFEIVINNDPGVAYLLEYNTPIDQKSLMVHVYAHVDFFKNNYTFKETDRNMINTMTNHSITFQKYIDKIGLEKVEEFIDACLSIDNLIDPQSVRIKREPEKEKFGKGKEGSGKLPAKDYMDKFINPEEALKTEKKKLEEELKKSKHKIPANPQRDVLKFIIEHSDKMPRWQKDILSMIREEKYYFMPQGQTKITNEGWAYYWESQLMSTKRMAGVEGIIEFARKQSRVAGSKPGPITPYLLGSMLFRHIKERWDKGKHGLEYERETNLKKRKNWDTKENKGLEKIFEVRKTKNDIGLIREFLTPDFVRDSQLFLWQYDDYDGVPRISNRDAKNIQKKMLQQLTNGGEPAIEVVDGNYHNRKELYLQHKPTGFYLDIPDARKTLESIYKMWQRPVHIKTIAETEQEEQVCALLSFDGEKHHVTKSCTKKCKHPKIKKEMRIF